MAELKAFEMGANVITSYKNKDFAAMTCAWSMMCDYDKILMLLGKQSDTAKKIIKGDKVGVSALSKGQIMIAKHFGETHSSEFPKFNQHYLEKLNGVYVVKEAKVKMECEVIDILHLPGIEDDSLLYLKVINFKDDVNKKFLTYDDFLNIEGE